MLGALKRSGNILFVRYVTHFRILKVIVSIVCKCALKGFECKVTCKDLSPFNYNVNVV